MKKSKKRTRFALRPRWDKHTDAEEIASAIRGRWIKVESNIMPGTYRMIRVGKLKKITSMSREGTRIRREVHFIDAETGAFRAVKIGDIVKVSD